MFKLSQKSDYGLILLSSLAGYHSRSVSRLAPKIHSGSVASNSYVSISFIAKKHNISHKFLAQIASELKKAGILFSKEGASGGYTLAKNPTDIKVLDVLKVLDGDLVKGECFEDDHECICGAKDMWGEMREQMEETLGKKTVADLVVK